MSLAEIISGLSIIFGSAAGTLDLFSHFWGWLADMNDSVQGILYWLTDLQAFFGALIG